MSDILNNPEEYFNKLSDKELRELLEEYGIEFEILEVGTHKGNSDSESCKILNKCLSKLKSMSEECDIKRDEE